MDTKQRFVIFSLDQAGNPATKTERESAREFLSTQGIGTKELVGSYKGSQETSILAVVNDSTKLGLVLELAKSYAQESVLIVDEDRTARLKFIADGSEQALGSFKAIDAEEAAGLDAWTFDPSTMQYFAAN